MKIPFKTSTISYSVTGNGPAIIWLHGFLESKNIWFPLVSTFNSKFTNICIDLLGHGNTGNVNDIYTMQLQAEAVTTVIKELNIESFAVIGHSMGGYIGLALLEHFNTQITHFVLLNSTSYPDTSEKKQHRDRAIKLVTNQKQNFIRMGIVNLFSDSFKSSHSKAIEALVLYAKKTSSKGIVAAIHGMRNRKSKTDVLNQFKGKKLIIAGKEDPVIPLTQSIQEANKTYSQLLKLSGGHMSYLESISELTLGLQLFLKA